MSKRGITYAQIKRAIPNLEETGRSEEFEALGARVDKKEAVEKFLKSKDGQEFRDHFTHEIAETLDTLFASVEDHKKVMVIVARLQVLINFYKMMSHVEKDAESMRLMVEELIDEVL